MKWRLICFNKVLIHLFSPRIWTQEVRSARKELQDPNLTRVLLKAYGKSYALAGLYVFSLVCSESYLYFINN